MFVKDLDGILQIPALKNRPRPMPERRKGRSVKDKKILEAGRDGIQKQMPETALPCRKPGRIRRGGRSGCPVKQRDGRQTGRMPFYSAQSTLHRYAISQSSSSASKTSKGRPSISPLSSKSAAARIYLCSSSVCERT